MPYVILGFYSTIDFAWLDWKMFEFKDLINFLTLLNDIKNRLHMTIDFETNRFEIQ